MQVLRIRGRWFRRFRFCGFWQGSRCVLGVDGLCFVRFGDWFGGDFLLDGCYDGGGCFFGFVSESGLSPERLVGNSLDGSEGFSEA